MREFVIGALAALVIAPVSLRAQSAAPPKVSMAKVRRLVSELADD